MTSTNGQGHTKGRANDEFDWTEILPEPERSKVREEFTRNASEFFEKFPTKSEIAQAGLEGKRAFVRACDQVDAAKIARQMMDLVDFFASSLVQPDDVRAWHHLLIYAPTDVLEEALSRRAALSRVSGGER